MPFNQSLVDELNLLVRFNLNTAQEGIKVHSTADARVIDAAMRLLAPGGSLYFSNNLSRLS